MLSTIIRQRRYAVTAAISGVLFVAVYLAATQFMIWEGVRESIVQGFVLENWQELLFRQRAPFLFEAIGELHIAGVTLFLSVVNIAIGMLMGLLVGLSIAVSYYSFRSLSLRGVRGFSSLVATVPAIVSGAACCVPTLILVIGLQMTAALAALFPFFVPASIILLVAALWWSVRKVEKGKL